MTTGKIDSEAGEMMSSQVYDSGRGDDDGDTDTASARSRRRSHGAISSHLERPLLPSNASQRVELIEEDEGPLQIDLAPALAVAEDKEEAVTWTSLPHKRQLIILACARLSEPLVQTSLRSYLFYQLKSFDPSLPDSAIASQAGIMQSAFAAAQLCTAMLWGRVSDRSGRKKVLLVGLFGTTISVLGFGFSTTFWQAMLFRMMGGALNGNIGVMRTMISEIVREKKYQSRAFLLLPMCANAGAIIGPVLGGLLADPVSSYPQWFAGIPWLLKFPYAPPNLLNACFLATSACAVFFALEETHEILGQEEDLGRRCGRNMVNFARQLVGKGKAHGYTLLDRDESRQSIDSVELQQSHTTKKMKKATPRYRNKLPFHRIFTYNVVCTLIAHALLAFSQGTFQNIFFIFLSTPVYDAAHHNPPPEYTPRPPVFFTGGLGLSPVEVGSSMAILGALGISLQLFLYPTISARLGTVRAWRIFLYLFPVVYALTPFLALVPSREPPPHPKSGPLVWLALTGIIFIRVIAATFSTPAAAILINNCSPHPSVLGTVHGIGQSASSAARTIGPALGGWLYGVGLDHGVVGTAFWGLMLMAVLTVVASNFVRDGDGHEIWLEGDEEDVDEENATGDEERR